MLDVCFAGDAHIGDICSPVGAQGWNINKQVPGVEPGSLVRRMVPSRVKGPDRLETAAGVFKYRVLPFGTLLGPEITGPKNFKPSLEGLEGTRVRVVSDCSCAGPRL